jgi:hypothetical protein
MGNAVRSALLVVGMGKSRPSEKGKEKRPSITEDEEVPIQRKTIRPVTKAAKTSDIVLRPEQFVHLLLADHAYFK